MSVTIELRPDIQERVLVQAAAQGLTVEGYLQHIVEEIAGREPAHFQERASPDEWSRALREWSGSHGHETPGLSNEAISRASIYAERG